MEVKKEIQREYNPAHPNYKRWQMARDLSDERALFVESILSSELTVEGLIILDIGAGEGNTSRHFSQKNFVVSLEPKSERIKKISVTNSLQPLMADSLELPFKSRTFNLIILQDVIEHLTFKKELVENLKCILNEKGIIYLSTPNRFSMLNIISDPHWGMPFLCLFNRQQIKKYFLKYLRKSDYNRGDIAELLSLKDIIKLFGDSFSIMLSTKFSVNYLFDGGKGIVWSKLQLQLVKLLNNTGLSKLIRSVANDEIGIINNFFTPTFYIVMKKK